MARDFIAVMAACVMGVAHHKGDLEDAEARICPLTGRLAFKTNISHNVARNLEDRRGVEPLPEPPHVFSGRHLQYRVGKAVFMGCLNLGSCRSIKF